ncbi:iron complex transport system substrate-binding protein [Dysgonomonas sp. PH5-45]|uniref:ABC transporter substrate-binding protein n=1 Tax=unclassified Dysgonomonas TaxID=2630389 RepID=UPI002473E6D4|nr:MULTISPECIES: ABC transporter substrate-binding protein [unclassified Dysgonomonas]MDH6355568.1 iron complex transport system substrate-binding protein [Dysgonomonas sp. PH5-45]MDH6388465.1 iron complex transport system substrate-binding protein [Dysgonomonas sp. PH5-37]
MKCLNYILLLLVLLLASCKGDKNTHKQNQGIVTTAYEVAYAKGFSVVKTADYTEVTVRNPWDTTKILQKYILVDKQKQLPPDLPKGIVVRTPVSNVVAYSTLHCSTLDELNLIGIIKGVCEPEHIKIPFIKEGIVSGSIMNLGLGSSPDVEKIIDLNPEAIFADPIEGRSFGAIEKLNLPIIQTPDYMEPTALGRAEWLRFYSLFVGQEALADSIFNQTRDNYNAIKAKVAKAEKKPSVFFDVMFSGVWYIAGGKSFIANFINDAGASYPWQGDESTGALALTFEAVLDRAEKAEFWLIKYNTPSSDMTYNSLAKENKGYTQFHSFKNKNVYGCNTAYAAYYEDLPIHPDYVLNDFAAIFHPDLFPEYQLRYYKKLKE